MRKKPCTLFHAAVLVVLHHGGMIKAAEVKEGIVQKKMKRTTVNELSSAGACMSSRYAALAGRHLGILARIGTRRGKTDPRIQLEVRPPNMA